MTEFKKGDKVILQYTTPFRDFDTHDVYTVEAGTIGRVVKVMPKDGNVLAGNFVIKFPRVPMSVWCAADELLPVNPLERLARET